MIKILHNPRCTKSRQGLALLESMDQPFEVMKYLEEPLTLSELKSIIKKLDIDPIDLVRKNEAVWKSDFKGKELSDEEIIESMLLNPKLIERPIVIKGDKAVIGRPTEKILELVK